MHYKTLNYKNGGVLMSEKMNTRAMLLSDSPWKLVAKLSVPAIVGMVVVGLYNFMDGVYVGQMIGRSGRRTRL